MNDFHDSPSGLDPKDMKPWAEMSEVERLEYHDLIKRRARIRAMEASYQRYNQRSQIEETRQSVTQSIALAVLITFILILLFAC